MFFIDGEEFGMVLKSIRLGILFHFNCYQICFTYLDIFLLLSSTFSPIHFIHKFTRSRPLWTNVKINVKIFVRFDLPAYHAIILFDNIKTKSELANMRRNANRTLYKNVHFKSARIQTFVHQMKMRRRKMIFFDVIE